MLKQAAHSGTSGVRRSFYVDTILDWMYIYYNDMFFSLKAKKQSRMKDETTHGKTRKTHKADCTVSAKAR